MFDSDERIILGLLTEHDQRQVARSELARPLDGEDAGIRVDNELGAFDRANIVHQCDGLEQPTRAAVRADQLAHASWTAMRIG